MIAAAEMVGMAALFEAGVPCGMEANMGELLAAGALGSRPMSLQIHGGMGFAEEFDIECKFGETRLCGLGRSPRTSFCGNIRYRGEYLIMGGGPGRTRTCDQTVMSGQL
jgi:hypothetical protein